MNQTLKIFGLTQDEVNQKISAIKEKYDGTIKISVKEKYLDVAIDISSVNDNNISDAVREICEVLENNLYAESNQTLYEKLADCLLIRGKTICMLEQATGGVIAANLLAIDGMQEKVVKSLVLPSVSSWLSFADIPSNMLFESKGISSKLVFMLASALRRTTIADFYIVSISNSAAGIEVYKQTDSNDNFALVAIGDSTGVEIYKEQLSGSIRDQNNQVSKSICYKLINKLKK